MNHRDWQMAAYFQPTPEHALRALPVVEIDGTQYVRLDAARDLLTEGVRVLQLAAARGEDMNHLPEQTQTRLNHAAARRALGAVLNLVIDRAFSGRAIHVTKHAHAEALSHYQELAREIRSAQA